jgi:hypothetical protein
MASHLETAETTLWRSPIDPWVWPAIAAIVMGGSILFWCFVGLFCLAMQPARPPIVVWPAAASVQEEQSANLNGHHAAIALEIRRDADAN